MLKRMLIRHPWPHDRGGQNRTEKEHTRHLLDVFGADLVETLRVPVEGTTGVNQGARRAVCQKYRIDPPVRDALGNLVSEKGGPEEARKLGAGATGTPLTPAEKTWIEEIVKALIRRKAEYDADTAAAGSLPLITMSEFPPP
jgi:hypothetical protein